MPREQNIIPKHRACDSQLNPGQLRSQGTWAGASGGQDTAYCLVSSC